MTGVDTHQDLVAIGDRYIDDAAFRPESVEPLAQVRAQCPVMQTSSGVWLVTNHEGLRSVTRDGDKFSRTQAAIRHTMLEPGPARDYFTSKMLWRDGADHARLRRLVTTVFTRNGIRRWEPMIQEVADSLIDAVEPRGSMDVVMDYGFALSERVICRLLGVPYEDKATWKSCVDRILEPPAGADQTPYKDVAAQAVLEFADYILALIDERRRSGLEQDDLLTRLIHAESSEDAALSETEMVALCLEFIGAGHETTGLFTGNLLWILLTHPDQFAEVKADRSLVDPAIDEALRLIGPAIITLPRAATEDIDLFGVTIPQGDTVLCLHDPADRDPAVFENPDVFDIHRSPNNHLAFGSGPHLCIGKNLAWAESRVALTTVMERLPGLALDPAKAPEWEAHRYLRGLETLPVVW